MDKSVSLGDVIRFIENTNLTNDEWSMLSGVMMDVRAKKYATASKKIYVGDSVKFYHKSMGATIMGKVESKGTKNAVVRGLGATPGMYRVPMVLLEKSV